MNLHLVWIGLKKPLFLIISMLVCCLFALCSFIFLKEWWIVYIQQKTHNYPWGPDNNNPWYFENPQLYGQVMFTAGLIMLILSGLTIYLICKKRKRATVVVLFTGLILLYLMIYNTPIV